MLMRPPSSGWYHRDLSPERRHWLGNGGLKSTAITEFPRSHETIQYKGMKSKYLPNGEVSNHANRR